MNSILKSFAIVVLTVGVAAGCADVSKSRPCARFPFEIVAQQCGADPLASRLSDDDYYEKVLGKAGKLCDKKLVPEIKDLQEGLGHKYYAGKIAFAKEQTETLPATEIYARRAGSVYFFAALYKCKRCSEWHMRGAGTAFALTEDGICVTARHNFEDSDDERIILADAEGSVFPLTEILASSAIDDLALLRIDADHLQPIPLKATAPIGSEVYVLSHPLLHFFSLTSGIVSRHCKWARLKESSAIWGRDKNTDTFDITADISVGSSGGPVMDPAGNAVGVAVITFLAKSDGTVDSKTMIRTCISADRIHALVREHDSDADEDAAAEKDDAQAKSDHKSP